MRPAKSGIANQVWPLPAVLVAILAVVASGQEERSQAAVDQQSLATGTEFVPEAGSRARSSERIGSDRAAGDGADTEGVGQHICDGHDTEWGECEDQPRCEGCRPINCVLSDWSDWWDGDGCVGLRFRDRSIEINNNKCGLPCKGATVESEAIRDTKEECINKKQDCLFGVWSQWSSCKDELDQSIRSRKVDKPPANGGHAYTCQGAAEETRPCGGPVSEACVFDSWSEWTTCSSSCGTGRYTRMRRILSESKLNGQTCNDAEMETAECKLKECPSKDCLLSVWTEWTPCNGAGSQKTRSREVTQSPEGETAIQCHNKSLVEAAGCPIPVLQDCELSDWAGWSTCTKTCSGGVQTRKRKLSKPNSHGGACALTALEEITECATQVCEESNCKVSSWDSWSDCSVKIGAGLMTRSRKVLNTATADGMGCNETLQEIKACEVAALVKVDCKWGDWGGWAACSQSCGGGHTMRSRAIAMAPQNGGAPCEPGDMQAVQPCNVQNCSNCTDGTWSEWAEWSNCSATCGAGFRSRQRDIDVQPNDCGDWPDGTHQDFDSCEGLPPCEADKDCNLSTWSQWTECSSNCSGTRDRFREVASLASGRGKPCNNATLREIEPCNPASGEEVPAGCKGTVGAAVDCVMGDWQAWSNCSSTCGGGQESRMRTIVTPATGRGNPCDKSLAMTRGCNTQPCHAEAVKDCQWSQWSDWSVCDQCGGQRKRHRTMDQMPNALGKLCTDQAVVEMSNCTSPCTTDEFCAWSEWSVPKCPSKCGHTAAFRNRALRLVPASSAGSFLFKGHPNSTCGGAQLDLAECPFKESCEKCVPKHCTFGAWTAWSEASCAGLCERHRVIAQTNNECGTPCQGVLSQTRHCDTTCERAIDCKMSEWTEWSPCANITSGPVSGQRKRQRQVLTKPGRGGKACSGDLEQTKACSAEMPAACEFDEWQHWSSCSVSCGEGQQLRLRAILHHAEDGGPQCNGDLRQVQACRHWDNQTCADFIEQDCELGDWSEWGDCGFSMQKRRKRGFKKLAQMGGLPCYGPLDETESCHRNVVDCVMSDWTQWESCSKTCGSGQSRRQRQITKFPAAGGAVCPKDLSQTRGCNHEQCETQDCRVSGWMEWGDCSTSCGTGHQTRKRTILSLREAGGAGCYFKLAEMQSCENKECSKDCEWGEWQSWSGCSQSCGGGLMNRLRKIATLPTPGGSACDMKDMKEVLPCNMGECGTVCVDGLWEDWVEWSTCSKTCAGGERFRTRDVKRTANSCGKPAVGKSQEAEFCNVEVPCHAPIDCLFTAWSNWNECSASCNGVSMRTRKIGQYGHGTGLYCKGGVKETRACNPVEDKSPPAGCVRGPRVDCVISEWNPWSTCSATCDGGEKHRSRKILQEPKHGGFACKEALEETHECGRDPCSGPRPVDCVLGDWKEWGACSSCKGERTRFRKILAYPEHGGLGCPPAGLEEVGVCPHTCDFETTCSWASWESWGSCTTTCGTGGKRQRTRYLKATTQPITSISDASTGSDDSSGSVIERYDALYHRTQDLEINHTQEVLLAFAAGCLSLVAVGLVLRVGRTNADAPQHQRIIAAADASPLRGAGSDADAEIPLVEGRSFWA